MPCDQSYKETPHTVRIPRRPNLVLLTTVVLMTLGDLGHLVPLHVTVVRQPELGRLRLVRLAIVLLLDKVRIVTLNGAVHTVVGHLGHLVLVLVEVAQPNPLVTSSLVTSATAPTPEKLSLVHLTLAVNTTLNGLPGVLALAPVVPEHSQEPEQPRMVALQAVLPSKTNLAISRTVVHMVTGDLGLLVTNPVVVVTRTVNVYFSPV